jgi:hypothetical protein
MQHIQALIEKGWVLRVRKDRSEFVAHVDDPTPNPQLSTVVGHAHPGKTIADAIANLEGYVAAQGKEVLREK